ncbi:MAG: hypothetical protein M1815_002526 [Lichina confinis]|nr:MAG: hypothetical protein M1815_002526 [Lichina confinis]
MSLMLNILQCESDRVAIDSRKELESMMKQVLEQNGDMRKRLAQLERTYGAAMASLRHLDDESSTIRPYTGKVDATEQPNPSSLEGGVMDFPIRREFKVDLEAPRAYQRTTNNACDVSLATSAVETHAWSVLSGLSLADISIISVIALPLSSQETISMQPHSTPGAETGPTGISRVLTPGPKRSSAISPKVARTLATMAKYFPPLVQPQPDRVAVRQTTAKFQLMSAGPSPIQLCDIPTLTLVYELNQLTPFSLPAYAPCVSHNNKISLIRQDITKLEVGCIFNAARRPLLGGDGVDGVDGAIHHAAGLELVKECMKLKGCNAGDANITNGYKLPCSKIIHAVGPKYNEANRDGMEKTLLRSCYRRSLELAAENDCRSVAFSAIGKGNLRWPSVEAAYTAVDEVRKFLDGGMGESLERIVFCNFDEENVRAYLQVIPQVSLSLSSGHLG